MKFTANREQLLAQVRTALKAASATSVVEVLKGILVEADEGSNTLTFIGTNYEVAIQCMMDTYVETGGSMVINGKLFSGLLALFNQEEVTVSQNRSTECGNGRKAHLDYTGSFIQPIIRVSKRQRRFRSRHNRVKGGLFKRGASLFSKTYRRKLPRH